MPRLGVAVWDVLRTVTTFAQEHSITLLLATPGLMALPSWLVEVTSAASMVLAALYNLFQVVHGRRWMVAFGFWLFHGVGLSAARR